MNCLQNLLEILAKMCIFRLAAGCNLTKSDAPKN